MKILKEGEIKKVLVANILITIILVILLCIITKVYEDKYVKILNDRITNIVNNITLKYPDVDEVEIVKELNKEEYDKKNSVLQKYGYTDEEVYIKSIKNEMKNMVKVDVIVVISFGTIYFAITYIYILKKQKKIIEINEDLRKINNRNYVLNIEDNEENEISKLRNELYKTTVLLKETAENSILEKQKLSDSLADISHQLKTPLTSIRIMLDNIEEDENMDEVTRKEFLKDISRQIEWISSLVILLLKLAKLDAGAIKFNNAKIEINKLIKEIIKDLEILLEIKNINVITNIPQKATIYGDYKWQKEAMTNIIKNAIEHSKENSKINIDVEDSSVLLKIIIKDSGEGIDKEDKKHIFERFYKAKNVSESSIGIGLAFAKTIIEKNNGYITVESELGKGTSFEIKYIKY